MRWVRHFQALHDLIGFVVMRAPDRFPKEDFLADEEQLTLDRAFEELRSGLKFVAVPADDPSYHNRLCTKLEASLAAYRAGDRKQGAYLLQDFQDMIFGPSNDAT